MKKLLALLIIIFACISCEKSHVFFEDKETVKNEWIVDFIVTHVEYSQNIEDSIYNVEHQVNERSTLYLNRITMQSVEKVDFKPKYPHFEYCDLYERFCEYEGYDNNFDEYRNNHPFLGKIVTVEFVFNEKYYLDMDVMPDEIMHWHIVKGKGFYAGSNYKSRYEGMYTIIVHSNDGIPHFDKYRKN